MAALQAGCWHLAFQVLLARMEEGPRAYCVTHPCTFAMAIGIDKPRGQVTYEYQRQATGHQTQQFATKRAKPLLLPHPDSIRLIPLLPPSLDNRMKEKTRQRCGHSELDRREQQRSQRKTYFGVLDTTLVLISLQFPPFPFLFLFRVSGPGSTTPPSRWSPAQDASPGSPPPAYPSREKRPRAQVLPKWLACYRHPGASSSSPALLRSTGWVPG